MRRGSAVVLLLVLLASACGGDDPPRGSAEYGPGTATEPATTETAPQDAPVFEEGHVFIETGEGEPASVLVEVAEEPVQHQYGLMFRESLPRDRGMIFVFDSEQTGGFWMKDTLIPLSIAFYGKNGRILEILDMEPCEADPCPTYDPGVPYRGALEVNRGAFERWGVRPGDRIVLHRL